MGIALWTACAVVLFAAARFVSAGRAARWVGELITVLISAMIFGLVATFLDFGGWNELDWRAGLFVFFGAAAMVAIVRIAGVASRKSGVGANSRFAATAAFAHTAKSHATFSPTPDTRRPTPADPTPDPRQPTPAK